MGFDEDGFAGGQSDLEKEWDAAGEVADEALDFAQAIRSEMGGLQAEVDLLSELFWRVLQRHDFGGEDFGAVFAVVDFADDEEGFVHFEVLAVFVVVFVHGQYLEGALEVFDGEHGVGFVVFLGDALLDCANEAAQAGHAAGGEVHGGLGVGEGEFVEDGSEGGEWVAGDVEA